MISAALDRGAQKIILGVGGSATIDGGSGAMQALGARFLDGKKNELTGMPESLTRLGSIDLSQLDKRIFDTEFIILCDVQNFLLGDKGAAAVFGPQKGASAQEVIHLENSLSRLREISLSQTGIDMNRIRHGGAAGGISAGMNVFFKARLVEGIEYFLDITKFDDSLTDTDILITGEGSIDLQTLEGKAPFGVAKRAKKKNIPVIGMAGKLTQTINTALSQYFNFLIEINQPGEDLKTAMSHTKENLRRSARRLGTMISEKGLDGSESKIILPRSSETNGYPARKKQSHNRW